ncbi:MAG: hypothetical protein QXE45_06680, partial [Thermoplasmata archaeon]
MMAMPTWDIRIIDITYRVRYVTERQPSIEQTAIGQQINQKEKKAKGDLILQIYGKTKDGKSITAIHKNFRPYFYVVEPNEQIIEMLEADAENVKEVEKEPTMLFLGGKNVSCRKVVTTFPFVVPQVREKL